ncbi:MAG: glutathione peroxidase [Bacteroidales bacterium]|nr:glutathione peroxidase [Bacteroidales bacterium]
MKRIIFIMIMAASVSSLYSQGQSIYDFKVQTLEGEDFSFEQLKGKKVMIVNTASKCGFTPQYEDLQELWEQYGGDDFIIIGFPANNFMNQEPGSDEEIKEFCTRNYGVTFPMMSKVSVKGNDMHPVYKWLTEKELNNFEDSKVQWNFQKYLIDEKGKLVKVIKPRVKPTDPEILNWLNE